MCRSRKKICTKPKKCTVDINNNGKIYTRDGNDTITARFDRSVNSYEYGFGFTLNRVLPAPPSSFFLEDVGKPAGGKTASN